MGVNVELVTLLNQANKGYTDAFLSEYYDVVTGQLKNGSGDGLAKFIVVELAETWEDTADEYQLAEAIRCMEAARDELDSVITALAQYKPPKKFNHAFEIAFQLESDNDGENVTSEELLAAIGLRYQLLCEDYNAGNGAEVIEACGMPYDTYSNYEDEASEPQKGEGFPLCYIW